MSDTGETVLAHKTTRANRIVDGDRILVAGVQRQVVRSRGYRDLMVLTLDNGDTLRFPEDQYVYYLSGWSKEDDGETLTA